MLDAEPNPSQLELQLVDAGDELDDDERTALHRSLEAGLADAGRGEPRRPRSNEN